MAGGGGSSGVGAGGDEVSRGFPGGCLGLRYNGVVMSREPRRRRDGGRLTRPGFSELGDFAALGDGGAGVEKHAEQRDRAAGDALQLGELIAAVAHRAHGVDGRGDAQRGGDRLAQALAAAGGVMAVAGGLRGELQGVERGVAGALAQASGQRVAAR